jgi:superfamily I DNA and/or RNA helicase
MDSPNRLNVALTRAKYQMVVVGNKEYFSTCKSELLKAVAQEYK